MLGNSGGGWTGRLVIPGACGRADTPESLQTFVGWSFMREPGALGRLARRTTHNSDERALADPPSPDSSNSMADYFGSFSDASSPPHESYLSPLDSPTESPRTKSKPPPPITPPRHQPSTESLRPRILSPGQLVTVLPGERTGPPKPKSRACFAASPRNLVLMLSFETLLHTRVPQILSIIRIPTRRTTALGPLGRIGRARLGDVVRDARLVDRVRVVESVHGRGRGKIAEGVGRS